jgi:tetratricopeptide (TPR) repeat protein
MKRTNYKIFIGLLLVAAIFSSCGLNRMVRNYDEGVKYTPATNPLENHGGQVAAEVAGRISEGYFLRRAMLEITPVLVYEGGETELQTVTLRGSRTTAEGQMVQGDRGAAFNMNNIIEYTPEMEESELIIRARLYREGREGRATNLRERKIADGIVVTSQRVDKSDMVTLVAPHEYELETIHTRQAALYFEYMRHNVNMRLPLNRDQENQQKLQDLEEFLLRGWRIHSIEVNAWASPEGEIAFNERLSQNRATTGERFFRDMVRRLERQHRRTIERPELAVNARGEDFQNFMVALDKSNLPDKQAIANVINSQLAPAERERRIRDMTVIYGEIEEILQPLRRAEFVVRAYEPKRTMQEIAELSTNNPRELSLAELLYAATLTEDLQTQLNIYQSAQEIFPRDYRGFNNAGAVHLKMRNYERAAQALERANQLAPNNGYIQNNLGVLAAINADYQNARDLFGTAQEWGLNTSYNQGVMRILAGDYQGALTSMRGFTCTYNLALAQLMTGNTQQAINTLDCAPESANVHYLRAVIAARQNEANRAFESLRSAVSMNPQMAEEARKDREFIRFFQQDEFQQALRR